MTDEIQKLIASLRLGEYEDPSEKISLLSAALVEHNADVTLLLTLLRAPQVPLRLAAMAASGKRTEEEILQELLLLAADVEERVRLKLAEVLADRSDNASTEVLKKLVIDSAGSVRVAALKSSSGRPECRELQQEALAEDGEWSVRISAASALDAQASTQVVRALAASLQADDDGDVQRRCAESIEIARRHFRAHKASGTAEGTWGKAFPKVGCVGSSRRLPRR